MAYVVCLTVMPPASARDGTRDNNVAAFTNIAKMGRPTRRRVRPLIRALEAVGVAIMGVLRWRIIAQKIGAVTTSQSSR